MEENREYPVKEQAITNEDILNYEQSIIEGLLAAVDEKDQIKKTVAVVRPNPKNPSEKKEYFRFDVMGLDEDIYNKCRKQSTSYTKVRQLGNIKMPEETDTAEFRSRLIYEATVPDEKLGNIKIWDRPEIKKALEKKYKNRIFSGFEIVNELLLAGEKELVVNLIDTLSGFDSNLEDIAKK